jgi:hypothetical protein
LAANSNCTLSVNVVAPTAGSKANTTGTITSTEGGAGLTGSATLVVTAAVVTPVLSVPAMILFGIMLVGSGLFFSRRNAWSR